MLRIVTDTASDITLAQAEALGVDMVSLEITFEDGPCPQSTEEDFRIFYERLSRCSELPVTSRPAPDSYLRIFLDAKSKDEEVLVLSVSSGLSGTIESAFTAKGMAEYDKITIVDTQQAILTQRMLVEYAVQLRQEGHDAASIAEKVVEMSKNLVVCGVVGTLKYLRKGGRIPASLAVVGSMLHIKPVIVLEDGILKTLGKARGHASGLGMLQKRIEADGVNTAYPVYFGYTSDKTLTQQAMEKFSQQYGWDHTRMHAVGGIIGTHCGTDCVAVAYVKNN
ncbi:MAG: DegV family protein [Clostridia bacterium]|nr:DegV family protein [Clostridia bacterium]